MAPSNHFLVLLAIIHVRKWGQFFFLNQKTIILLESCGNKGMLWWNSFLVIMRESREKKTSFSGLEQCYSLCSFFNPGDFLYFYNVISHRREYLHSIFDPEAPCKAIGGLYLFSCFQAAHLFLINQLTYKHLLCSFSDLVLPVFSPLGHKSAAHWADHSNYKPVLNSHCMRWCNVSLSSTMKSIA